jgi:hypothetical protein
MEKFDLVDWLYNSIIFWTIGAIVSFALLTTISNIPLGSAVCWLAALALSVIHLARLSVTR